MDESDAPAAADLNETRSAEPKPARTLRPLVMIWRQALCYPRHLIFALLALMTTSAATLAIPARFFFVSWLGERVVADIRLLVQTNLLRMPPSFFEDNSPREISSRKIGRAHV